jgi:2-keto-4-pentenoate hydratase/2-oxohepta-3-ene-1,7-dioic acid hydratase in catechol pathway
VKLATFRAGNRVSYGAVSGGDHVTDLGAVLGQKYPRLIDVIAAGALEECRQAMVAAPRVPLRQVQLLPPVPGAEKIICVGVNYPDRNAEYKDGSDQPKNPSLFMRTPGSLVGHGEAIVRPAESIQFDYEGEIVMVIGKGGRRIPAARAREHVFGLTLMNEGSVRDWIRHGKFNVTQGKNFDRSGSIGPWIVTADDLPAFDALPLTTEVNGEERQRGATGELMFSFETLIAYISTFTTLAPGDIISTGTPVGAGARFDPPRWLKPGDVVRVASPQIGVLSNEVADEVA